MGVVIKGNETYNIQVSDTGGKYTIPVSVTRVDCAELLSVENPS